MRISRLWRHLKMLRRSGFGVDPRGVSAAGNGDCAVECPACPRPLICPRQEMSFDPGTRTEKGDPRCALTYIGESADLTTYVQLD